MRGRTFKNAVIILDEAQNTTPTQMKLFLTRIGEGCTVIVNGDITQKDIPGASGLGDALLRMGGIPGVEIVRFTSADVVRSGLVQKIVEAYEKPVTAAS
ncbi:Protein PhoH [compost metagenome]